MRRIILYLGSFVLCGCILINFPEPKDDIPQWMREPQHQIPGTPEYVDDFPLDGEEQTLQEFYTQSVSSGSSVAKKEEISSNNNIKSKTPSSPFQKHKPQMVRFHQFSLQNEVPSDSSPYLVEEDYKK